MELAASKKRFIQSVLLLQIEKSKCKMQLSNMIFAILHFDFSYLSLRSGLKDFLDKVQFIF